MDDTDDELFVTISPIDTDKPSIQPVTDTSSSSSSTPRTVSTSGLYPSSEAPVVVTRAPILIENHHFNLLLIIFFLKFNYKNCINICNFV